MTRFAAVLPLAALALAAAPAPAHAAWTWPLRGEILTAFRNVDDPYAAGQHRGVDIAGSVGATVVAATPGLVRFAGTAGSSGTVVSVRSADGAYDLSYLHLASLAVRRGQQVAAGQALGSVGTTGVRSVDRPHLHFGVRRAGSRHAYVDPLALLPPLGAPAPRPPAAVPVAAPLPVRPAPSPHPPRIRLREPVPEPRPSPRPLPAPADAPEPRPVALARPRPLVAARPERRAGASRSLPAQARQEPARLGAAPRAAAPAAAPGRAAAGGAARHGPDLGGLAACAGLLGAALALSTGGGAGGARASLRSRLAALRPALAGRAPRTRE
jgi:outer membrane biosynthesis protein TonB